MAPRAVRRARLPLLQEHARRAVRAGPGVAQLAAEELHDHRALCPGYPGVGGSGKLLVFADCVNLADGKQLPVFIGILWLLQI